MVNQHRLLRVLQLIAVLKNKPYKNYHFLSEFLEVSGRTAYRYLDLLKAVGVKVSKGPNFTFYIPDNGSKGLEVKLFTKQEVDHMDKVLNSFANGHPLNEGIIEKYNLASETTALIKGAGQTHHSQNIEALSSAMVAQQQVILKQYQSASSQTVSDRLVEPVGFTDNYVSLCAFEVASQKNKYFNIDRIARVAVTNTPMAFEELHEYHEPDVFGFQASTLDKEVSFTLSMRVYLIFRTEYPRSLKYLKEIPELGRYHFHAPVQDYRAAGRFVRGFGKDIEVLGSPGFLEYLKSMESR